jgi:hypothetical protein
MENRFIPGVLQQEIGNVWPLISKDSIRPAVHRPTEKMDLSHIDLPKKSGRYLKYVLIKKILIISKLRRKCCKIKIFWSESNK